MITPSTDLLSLEIQMPTRWVKGEERLIKLRLRNEGGVDLKQLGIRTGWWGAEQGEDKWKSHGTLRRGAVLDVALHSAPPPRREDQFRLEVRAQAGAHLELELWSAKIDVHTRPRPGAAGPVHVVFKNSGISGDKIGFGQMASEGSAHVGHQVHLHGSNATTDFEHWLAEDAAAAQMQPLPLYLVMEKCLPWTNAQEMELLGIMRGEFIMGADRADADATPEEKVRRDICLTRSFWMAQHQVTNAQWAAVMETPTPVTLKGHQADRMPVANVTWGQAVDFCARLTEMEKAAGALPQGYVYRLSTEAEWEYACRAGNTTPHYGPLAKIGSVLANGGSMVEVGRFEANAWGLQDMLGLVFEWCLDAFAPYNPAETTDPVCWGDPQKPLLRVIRGGCYQGPDVFSRASARFGRMPQSASHRVGFRVVLVRE